MTNLDVHDGPGRAGLESSTTLAWKHQAPRYVGVYESLIAGVSNTSAAVTAGA